MLTRIPNETGVITYSKNALEDIIRGAFAGCKGQCWLSSRFSAGSMELSYSEEGVFVRISCIVRVGTPIRSTLKDIISFIASNITECLELPVDNIIMNVVAVAGTKNTLKRDITLDYYSNYVNADDEDDGSEE